MFFLFVFPLNFFSSFPRRSGGQQDRRLSVKKWTHTIISFCLLLLLLLSSSDCNKLNKRRRERRQHQKKCGLVHAEKKLPRAEWQTRADRPNGTERNESTKGNVRDFVWMKEGRGMFPCFSPVSLNYISKTNLSSPQQFPFHSLYTSSSYTTTLIV